MTIAYQFLEGAKLGSRYGGHIGQIQDGHLPYVVGRCHNLRTKSSTTMNDTTFWWVLSMESPFLVLF